MLKVPKQVVYRLFGDLHTFSQLSGPSTVQTLIAEKRHMGWVQISVSILQDSPVDAFSDALPSLTEQGSDSRPINRAFLVIWILTA